MKNISLEQMAIMIREGLKLDEQVEINGNLEYFTWLEVNSVFLRKEGDFRLVSYGNDRYSLRDGKDFALIFEIDRKRNMTVNRRESSVNIPTNLTPEASITIQQKGDIRY